MPRAAGTRTWQRREARARQSYREFLKRVCVRGKMSEDFAERATVAVLCALGERLSEEEALDLEAQLPMRLQAQLYRRIRRPGQAPPRFGLEELLARVGDELGLQPDEAEPVVRAVLAVVREQVSDGEAQDVAAQLPADMRSLW